jgi:hypothetical protein
MFAVFPNEILDMILGQLPLHDIRLFQRTCRTIYKLVNDLYGDSMRPRNDSIDLKSQMLQCVNKIIHKSGRLQGNTVSSSISGTDFEYVYMYQVWYTNNKGYDIDNNTLRTCSKNLKYRFDTNITGNVIKMVRLPNFKN